MTMKSSYIYRSLLIGLFVALLFTAAACTKDDSEDKTNNNNETEVTLQSEKGEVTIPKNVEKILAPYHEDSLLAFDVQPVAKWAIGASVQDYLEPELKDIPTIEWDMPLEQVLELDPDLIILENDLDSYDGTYEDYNKIAPTYVMSEETTADWRKQIELFGEMLHQEDEAEQIVQDYDEKIADAREELNDAIGDERIAAIWVTGDKFFLFEKNRHSAEMIYSELGIEIPGLVEELGEGEEAWNPISIEKLSELDAEHIFLLAEEDEEGLKTLHDSKVWQGVPAVEEGNVYHIEDESNWTNGGLTASYKTIEDLFDTLVD